MAGGASRRRRATVRISCVAEMIASLINRLLIVLIAFVVLVGAIITLLVAGGVSGPEQFGWLQVPLETVTGGASAFGIMAIGGVVAAAMLCVLVFELRPPRAASFLVSTGENGITTIDKDSIILLAEKVGASFHNIRSIRCHVWEDAGHIDFYCRVVLVMGSDVVEAGKELQSKIKQTVEQLTGLCVVTVDVRAKYETGKSRHLTAR